MKPVTISLAYSALTSTNNPSSEISVRASAASAISADISAHTLLRSSWLSVYTAPSSLLDGSIDTSCLTPLAIVSSSPMKSATPALAINSALDVSSLDS